MRSKNHLLAIATVVAAGAFGLASATAGAATSTIQLTAQRMSKTLPDGTTVPMWGYCSNQLATDPTLGGAKLVNQNACSAPTAAGVATVGAWAPGPTIVVPAGNALTITLTNNIAVGTSTSLVILGQIGGSAGSPVRDAAPVVHAPATTTTWPNNGTAPVASAPPTQVARARSFALEAAFGSSVTYTWNTNITPTAATPTYLKPGTYIYETGSHPSLQAPMGLYGVLVVTTAPTANTAPTATTFTPGQAFPGAYVGGPASLTALQNVPYDSDAVVLFSEIDAVQNAATDAAAVANTPENIPWNDPRCLASQTAAPAGAQVACYPAAVNYAPTYFLVNGSPYDPTNPVGTTLATPVPVVGHNLMMRIANAGLRVHTPALVNNSFELIAEDGNLAPGAPKIQSEINMPAGKTYDTIVIRAGNTPMTGTNGMPYAEQSVIPFYDRALSLATGNRASGGLAGYLVTTNDVLTQTGATLAASLNSIIAGKAAGKIAAKANPDVFTLSPNATSFSGNVLTNDISVTNVGMGTLPTGGFTGPSTLALSYGSVTLNPDGSFTWSVAAAAPPTTAPTFTYCGLPAGAGTCALVTLNFEKFGNAPVAVARTYDNTPTTAYPSNVSSLIRVPAGAGVLVGAVDPSNFPLTAQFPSGTTAPAWVSLNPDGSFIATPCATAFPVSCSFQFVAVNSQGTASAPMAATIVFPAGSGLPVNVVDAITGTPIPSNDYGWLIEEDQTWHNATPGVTPPFVPGATPPPSLATSFFHSYMPIVAGGCTGPLSCGDAQTVLGSAAAPHPRSFPGDVVLDPTKYYYISILPGDASNPFVAGSGTNPILDPQCGAQVGVLSNCGHTMGGAPIAPLTAGSAGGYAARPVTVTAEPSPLPPAQLSIYIFDDNAPTNGDPDANEHGLGGFEIIVNDVAGRSGDPVGQVTYDAFNQPLTNALLGTPGCPNVYSPTPSGASSANSHYAGKDLTGVVITCPNDPVDPNNPSAAYAMQGMALIKNLMPGRYDVIAHPGAAREGKGEIWYQVSTLEGTPGQDAFTKAGEPAYFQEFGPPGFHTFIGFVNPAEIAAQSGVARHPGTVPNDAGSEPNENPPTGGGPPIPTTTVSGRVTSLHMSRPIMENLWDSASRAPLAQSTCFVGINQAGETGMNIGFGVCDAQGNFQLTQVPVGSYMLVIWDQWLDQIIAFKAVQVTGQTTNPLQPTGPVALGDIPVFSWFTRVESSIYIDQNGNGVRDAGEPGVAAVPVRVRFRDGSISNTLFTDADGNAVFSELFPLFNWYVVESDRTRFAGTGVNVTVDTGGLPDCVTYSATGTNTVRTGGNAASGMPCAKTGGILNSSYVWTDPITNASYGGVPAGVSANTNRIDPGSTNYEGLQGFINQTQILDWGKRPLNAAETGGIQGMVVYASTRGFDDPSLEVQFMWEPGVARVKMNLYQEIANADGTTGLKLVDTTTTTSWDDYAAGTHAVSATNATQVPNLVCPGQDPKDPFLTYTLGAANQFKCYDGFHVWNQVQPAVYDGAYTFPTANCTVCIANPAGAALGPMLPPGKYVVESVLPPGFETVKEEDKNILIGDAWIAPAAQQFGALATIFIMPDQASVAEAYNPNNPNNSTLHLGFTNTTLKYPDCVGSPRTVPDFLSLFPNSGQVAPFAGATKPLCDKKEVILAPTDTGNATFFVFSPTPRASHFTGLILDDAAAEINSAAPDFGEKYALSYAPVSLRDHNGVEVERVYSDQWGTYNGVVYSTWQVNVPNPAGYSPNMLVTCMNDPGPIPDPSGTLDPATGKVKLITDPLYNPSFSNFCYTNPFMPGMTVYLDTPVLPVASFADGYNPPDCALPNATPAIWRVDGDTVGGHSGPWISANGPRTIKITSRGDVTVPNPNYQGPSATTPPYNQRTITRHYGFGTTAGVVTVGGTALTGVSWSDATITGTVPGSVTTDGELRIVSANGVASVDTVTVSIGGKTPTFVEPVFKNGAPAGVNAAGIPHPIQDAIDAATPGDLIIVDAGTYPELVVMWKPVRLQGVGAGASVINAAKYPTQKLEDWRPVINKLFGIDSFPGTVAGNTIGAAVPNPQVDPLPVQTVTGGVVLLEPTVLATEEGAGITVLAKTLPTCGPAGPSAYWQASTSNNGVITGVTAVPTGWDMGDSNFNCAASRIDGLGITGSDAGGGIFVNGWAHNLVISNNEIYGNASALHGGLRIGTPFEELTPPANSGFGYDNNISIHHNLITKNGTVEATPGTAGQPNATGSGAGISICTGTDNYKVNYNFICGNYSSGNAGGIGVIGLSTNGAISHNQILFNQSYQQTVSVNGGGISIEGDLTANPLLSNGTGNVTIDSNVIVGNFAEAGHGGGIQLSNVNGADVVAHPTKPASWYVATVMNNVITNNVAGWSGGGIYLVDTLRAVIKDNTIANNDAVGMAGALFGTSGRGPTTAYPSAAGISTDLTSTAILAALPSGSRSQYQYSVPNLLDDVIWHNRSFFIDGRTGTTNICSSNVVADAAAGNCTVLPAQTSVGQCTGSPAYWDVGAVGDASAAAPGITVPSGAGVILSGTGNPGFVNGYCNGGAANPAFAFEPGQPFLPPFSLAAAVTLDEAGNFVHLAFGPLYPTGDYRITNAGAAYGGGAATNGTTNAAGTDIVGSPRPTGTRYDVGAYQYGAAIGATGNVSVTPASLAFATGTVSSQVVTITNIGKTVVQFGAGTPITIASTPSGAFTAQNTCGVNLSPGGVCTVTVTYAVPAAPATATVSLAFVPQTGVPATRTVAVTGAAVNYSVAPTALTFATAAAPQPAGTVSATQTFTVTAGATALPLGPITVGGTNPFDFNVVSNTCPTATALAANAACVVGIAYAPSAPGTSTATVTVSPTNGAAAQAVTLTGYATTAAPSAYTLTPNPLAFGSVAVGSPAVVRVLSLHNASTAALPLSSFAITGADAGEFTLVTTACGTSLAAGGTCTMTVRYLAAYAGAVSASVIGPNPAQTVVLSATATGPSFALSPSPVAFATTQGVGTSSTPMTVTLSNTGVALTGVSVSIAGTNSASFSQSNTCGNSVGAGTAAVPTTCTISVTFTPQASGSNVATLSVSTTNPGSTPASVALTGQATSASLAGTTAFGNVTVGMSLANVFTYTNTSAAPITIATIGISGANALDFTSATTCSTTSPMPAGANCTITVTFKPSATAAEVATLTVTDTAGGAAPAALALTGTGVAANVAVAPAALLFPATAAGTVSAGAPVTITNNGLGAVAVAAPVVAVTTGTATDFGAVSACPAVLLAGANCVVTVTFAPFVGEASTTLDAGTVAIGGTVPALVPVSGLVQ